MMLNIEDISIGSTYSINKFLFYEVDEESAVIQTAYGITKVFDSRMIKLIKNWEENFRESISFSDLELLFKSDTNEAIDYLEHYGIIESLKINKTQINGIKILSNSKTIGNLLSETLKKKYENHMNVSQINSDEFEEQSFENNLFIIFLNPYDKKMVKTLLEKQKDLRNTVSLMGYVYANNFYLDCFYSVDWKLPCHNCHMGHIQSSLYLSDDQEATYQQLIDSLFSETKDQFLVGMPLNSIQELNIACLITNKVYAYLNDLNTINSQLLHAEDLNKCTLMDLITFKKYEDTSLHWEMCDCYE